MAAKNREVRQYQANINFLVGALRNIPYSGLGYTFVGETPYGNGVMIKLSHSVSFSSWGENITILLTPVGEQTSVDITSECAMPTQIVDWGKNKENVFKVFGYLQNQLAAPQQQYAQQPVQQPVQQYAPAPAANEVVCPKCGNRLDTSFKFCNVCGTQLQ